MAQGPKPYPVVYNADEGAIQYVFETGQVTIPEASVNAITALTGEVTASGPGSAAATVTNAAVIGKLLTGYVSGAGTVASTDTILQAVEKLNGNTALKLPLTGGTLSGNLALSNLSTVEFLTILGKAADTSTDAGGSAIYLAHNGPNNRQLMIADTAAAGTAGENGLCILTGNGSPQVFGAKADGSASATLLIGTANSNVEAMGTFSVGGSPAADILVQMDSTTKGLLPPRLSLAQREALGVAATGTLTVVDYTALSGLSVYINQNQLLEGSDWTAAVSNNDTAASLSSAIDALTLVNATVLTNVVTITAANFARSNTITLESDDDVNLTPSGSTLTGEVDPTTGLTIYNTQTTQLETYNGDVWSPAFSGYIFQHVSNNFTTTSNVFQDTGTSGQFTLADPSHAIEITICGLLFTSNGVAADAIATIYRDGVNLSSTNGLATIGGPAGLSQITSTLRFVDDPNDTLTHTYKVYVKNDDNTTSVGWGGSREVSIEFKEIV